MASVGSATGVSTVLGVSAATKKSAAIAAGVGTAAAVSGSVYAVGLSVCRPVATSAVALSSGTINDGAWTVKTKPLRVWTATTAQAEIWQPITDALIDENGEIIIDENAFYIIGDDDSSETWIIND